MSTDAEKERRDAEVERSEELFKKIIAWLSEYAADTYTTSEVLTGLTLTLDFECRRAGIDLIKLIDSMKIGLVKEVRKNTTA